MQRGLSEKRRDFVGADGEFDCVVEGYSLILGVDAPDLDPDELIRCQKIVVASLAPCPEQVLDQELAKMRASTITASGDAQDQMLRMAVYAEELEGYPQDVVVTVCRRFRRNLKFLPAVAELVQAIEDLMHERRALAEALAEGPRRVEAVPYAGEFENAAEREKWIADREQHYAEAGRSRADDPPQGREPPPEPDPPRQRLPDLAQDLARVRERMADHAANPVELTDEERRLWGNPDPPR